jgi:integrase/recombinase XerD
MSSTKIYVSHTKKFTAFLAARDKDLLHVDRKDLIDYLVCLKTERGIKHATIERIFTILSSFYTFLVDEGHISSNPVPSIQRRYLRKYKDNNDSEMRKIITVEQASLLLNSILDSRDKAIVVLLFKTGVRCGELCRLDVDDLNLYEGIIKLKATAKRSNRILPLDEEGLAVLRRWLKARETRNIKSILALFPSRNGTRMCSAQVKRLIVKYATQVGLHDPKSKKLEDKFTPHCCRHWFTTHLIRAGMPRDFVKELRGDVRREAIDIYNHIDRDELRESYLAHIPQLGI